MKVDRKDAHCRTCGGSLKIIDADDATLSVLCEDCGDEYVVEPDGLGDGGMDYWPRFMARKLERGEE